MRFTRTLPDYSVMYALPIYGMLSNRFVCAHLTAHGYNLPQRIHDYHQIVGTLLFQPSPGSDRNEPSTIYDTSHLFFFGDLNFRLAIPASHPLGTLSHEALTQKLASEADREVLKDCDELRIERDERRSCFVGFREGEFWKFKCSYKYKLGEVETYECVPSPCSVLHVLIAMYSRKRAPAWTDRIMYTTHTDAPDHPQDTAIENLLYTSIPSYTTSDHVRMRFVHCRAPCTDFLLPETYRLPPSPPPSSTGDSGNATPQTPSTARLYASARSMRDPQAVHGASPRADLRLHLVSAHTRRGGLYRSRYRELHPWPRRMGVVAVQRLRPTLTTYDRLAEVVCISKLLLYHPPLVRTLCRHVYCTVNGSNSTLHGYYWKLVGLVRVIHTSTSIEKVIRT